MLFTQLPTKQEMLAYKGNRGKKPDQKVFASRAEALKYYDEAVDYLETLYSNTRTGQDVEIMPGSVWLRTYLVPRRKGRRVLLNGKAKRILGLCAHFDDEAVGMGGLFAKAALEGHETYILTFCGGSSGRADHFLDEEEAWVVRLYETILSAQELGILEVHVLIGKNGIGLPEWLWGTSKKWARKIAMQLARRYNVHVLVAHHHNPKVDVHFDHTAVGRIARIWVKHGQWTDHHPTSFPDCRILGGEEILAPELWQYVVWAGERNPKYSFFIKFDLAVARRISRALGFHRTQTVPVKRGPWGINNSYAIASLMSKLAERFWRDVNNPQVFFVEGYVRVTGPQTVDSVTELFE